MASTSIIVLSLLLFLVIFTYSKAELGQPKETNMTLYLTDYPGTESTTTSEITDQSNGPLNFTKFGAISSTVEEFKKSSARIAQGQGIYVTSALDRSNTYLLVSIMFTNEQYKGSTLEIQGSSTQFGKVRELAVVGGTGKFRFARGYATFETIHNTASYATTQCNVTVLHY